jgi:hypothetical protein
MIQRRTITQLMPALFLAAASTLLVQPADAKSDGTRLRARLAGPAIGTVVPSGHADYRVRTGRARLNVEVEDVGLPVGTVLTVFLAGAQIGTITVAAVTLGGELELNTQDGANVPQVVRGAVVEVKNAGTTIISGNF